MKTRITTAVHGAWPHQQLRARDLVSGSHRQSPHEWNRRQSSRANGTGSTLTPAHHEASVPVMARITEAIVGIEGPVHQDEIARRVSALFGKSRTGSLIAAASLRGLQSLKMSSALVEQDGFCMTRGQSDTPPVRDRSAAPLTLQRADMLSPLEIRAAAKIAERENGQLSEDEMAIAITRLLGFKRTGPELKSAILSALG